MTTITDHITLQATAWSQMPLPVIGMRASMMVAMSTWLPAPQTGCHR